MTMKYSQFEIEGGSASNVLTLRLSGKLTANDYELCVPELDRMIETHGKVRIFMELEDFHGWTVAAAWEDAKFGLKHFSDIERIAIVGEKTWEKGMTLFSKPFIKAEIRYFDVSDLADAKAWVVAE